MLGFGGWNGTMIQYRLAAGKQYGHACRVDQAQEEVDTQNENHYYFYMTTLIYNNKVDVFIMMMMFMYTNYNEEVKRNLCGYIYIRERERERREEQRKIVRWREVNRL